MEERKNIRTLLFEYLDNNGYDGLCNPELECGCSKSELFPCCSCPDYCVPCNSKEVDGVTIFTI